MFRSNSKQGTPNEPLISISTETSDASKNKSSSIIDDCLKRLRRSKKPLLERDPQFQSIATAAEQNKNSGPRPTGSKS